MKLEILDQLPEAGEKGHSFLFVHGAYHGAWCWKENFLPYFSSKGFSAYALSLRGHGNSEGREHLHSFSLDDYVKDVLDAIALLKEKPILVGHSMGGAIVQKIAHLHPEKIKAAVLMASAPPNGTFKNILQLSLKNFKDVYRLSLFNKGITPDFPVRLLFSEELPSMTRDKLLTLLQPESAKVESELSKRFIPKSVSPEIPLLVMGSNKDKFFSEKTIRKIGKVYGTKPVILSHMGHDMMLDSRWKSAADQIITFVNESL